MYWLTFETSGDIQVFIVRANHLVLARIKAGIVGQKGRFQEGHQLDAKAVNKIPAKMIGRTLSHEEAFALLERIGA
jgi:rRNA processing protein Krr1/Pno1